MQVIHAIGHALAVSGSMAWQITWALILGFALSAIVQALVSKSSIARLLGGDGPRTLAVATGLGAASSSCSYAAVALARSLVRKGASFVAAMAFEIASTNLVIELGVLLALLMGWQFTAAEFGGGPVMIAVVALLLRRVASPRLLAAARAQADRGLAGSMEGHAAMDMSVAADGAAAGARPNQAPGGTASGGRPPEAPGGAAVGGRPPEAPRRSLPRRLLSPDGLTSVSHVFVMEWAAIIRDIVIGLLIAGCIGAWVPDSFWHGFFLAGHPLAALFWGPLIGPVVAILSFVCSIGNVPLAAILWKAGISFGGATSFIFADLIILPILNIYRKYYGLRMTAVILATFYAAMVVAGYVTELVFSGLGLVPARSSARVAVEAVSWNYTTWLNVAGLLIAGLLVFRFFRTGGWPMLRMMGGPADAEHDGHSHVPGGHDTGGHERGEHQTGDHRHGGIEAAEHRAGAPASGDATRHRQDHIDCQGTT
ncbi:MAG: permease [Streptosporangiaceae bacterium]